MIEWFLLEKGSAFATESEEIPTKKKPQEFNQKSYDNSDDLAKNILTKYLKRKGFKILSVEEDYNHDVVAMRNNKIVLFEVEIKTDYPFTTQDTFKFNTVSFLARKKRLHEIKPYTYVIICKETGWSVSAKSETIFKDKYIEKIEIDSKDRRGEDVFFRVPKDECKFVNLSG